MNTMTYLRTPFFSVLTAVGSLAFIVYWSIHHPAESSLAVGLALLACLVAMSVGMVAVMSLPKKRAPILGHSTVGGWLICLLMGLSAFLLAMPQIEMNRARTNIDNTTPELAVQVSEILRQNPLNLHGAISVLTPVLQSSLKPDDVDLFRQAHSAGVRGEVIDQVLANGFVHPNDKHALVQEMLSHAQQGNPEIAVLLASMVDTR